MTVKELIQQLLSSTSNLNATVYMSKMIDDIDVKPYYIKDISNEGTNDGVFIWIGEEK